MYVSNILIKRGVIRVAINKKSQIQRQTERLLFSCLVKALKSEQGEMILSVFLSCCGHAADKGQPSITASHLWVPVPGSVTLLISTVVA